MMLYIITLASLFIIPTYAVVGHGLNSPMLLEAHKTFSLFQLPTVAKAGQNTTTVDTNNMTPCTCGVFLSGQFKKGSVDPPTGDPAFISEIDQVFPCNYHGQKMCQSRCLDSIVKHLPNSAKMLCASIDRDIHKERAYMFIKNCAPNWINTNLSAGREYCCKAGEPYKCPIGLNLTAIAI